MDYLPIFVATKAHRIVVAGEGQLAEAKVPRGAQNRSDGDPIQCGAHAGDAGLGEVKRTTHA